MKKSKKQKSSSHLNVPFGVEGPSNFTPTCNPPDQIYQNCISEKIQSQILRYSFDPLQFKNWWNIYENQPNYKRAMRCLVQIRTIDACLRGKYFLPDNTPVNLNKKDLKSAAESTKLYRIEQSTTFESRCNEFQTEIFVIEGDCLETALFLKTVKKKN